MKLLPLRRSLRRAWAAGASLWLAAASWAMAVECDVSPGFPSPTRNQRDVGNCHANAAVDLLEHALKRAGRQARLSLADLFVMTTVAKPYFIAEVMDAYLGKTDAQAAFPEGGWTSQDVQYALANGVAQAGAVGDAETMENYVNFRSRMIDAMETYVNPAVRKRVARLSPQDEAVLAAIVDDYYAKHAREFAAFLSQVKSLTGWKDRDIKIMIRPFFYYQLSRVLAYEALAGKATPQANAERLKQLYASVGGLDAVEASRRQTLGLMRGLRPLAAAPGTPPAAWVEANLCRARRPVAVAINLKGLPGWNVSEDAGHEFLITGIRARDAHGHPYRFAVRNSWGTTISNHDVSADDLGHAMELFTVTAPDDPPLR